jgi:hypothetical protein
MEKACHSSGNPEAREQSELQMRSYKFDKEQSSESIGSCCAYHIEVLCRTDFSALPRNNLIHYPLEHIQSGEGAGTPSIYGVLAQVL